MASEESSQTMTGSARTKLQSVWTSLRSIKVDEDVAMLSKWTPRSSSSEDDNEGGGALENMVRTMFGSCTVFDPSGHDEASASVLSTRDRSRRRSGNHARAKQAVSSLREKAEQRESSPSHRKSSVSRPFPASSPSRKQGKGLPYLMHEVQVAPPPPPPPDLSASAPTFDDGISAISAHTLEELDRQNELKKPRKFSAVRSDLTHDEEGFETFINDAVSAESSLFPPTTAQSEEEERDCVGDPVDFSRGRSNNTWGSKKSVRTMSSESTDFEMVWRQEEQKYWEETVEKDEQLPRKGSVRHFNAMLKARDVRVRSRSRESEMLTLKQDGTNTTACSSAFSGMSSQHPHDTMPLEPSDVVPVSVRSPRMSRDPDRIQEMIAIDAHTEIGEI